MPATVATSPEPVSQALSQLEASGTIVISCSREDLLCLLAQDVLEKTASRPIVRHGRVENIIPIFNNIDQVRTLAELVLLYFE